MPQIYGKTNLTKPSETAASGAVQTAADEFGAIHTRSEILAFTEQGTHYRACNATFGTGLAHAIQTSWSATANALLVMRNGSTTVKVIPDYIRLICTVAPASATSANLGIILDTANRYSSGGTDLTTAIVNANSGQSTASVVDVLRFGGVTAAAATAPRQVGRGMIKTQAAPAVTVGDEILITFGKMSEGGAGGLLSGANVSRFIIPMSPVVLEGQNHCMVVYQWNPANAATAPSYEVEIGWFER